MKFLLLIPLSPLLLFAGVKLILSRKPERERLDTLAAWGGDY